MKTKQAQIENKARMTNVPSRTRPGPGALLSELRSLTRPVLAMPWPSANAMAWVHGLDGLTWRNGGPYLPNEVARHNGSRGTAHSRCQCGKGWRGGHASRARQAVIEKNPREKKSRARWDTSHLTCAYNVSN